VVLVNGVRSIERIRQVRAMIGDKPLLFNQIAGGKSPRLSLSVLPGLGVNGAICSTSCLFAARTAMDHVMWEPHAHDGRLPEVRESEAGVSASRSLLEANLSRHHHRNSLGEAVSVLLAHPRQPTRRKDSLAGHKTCRLDAWMPVMSLSQSPALIADLGANSDIKQALLVAATPRAMTLGRRRARACRD
jgi:hypothetical protein